MYHPEDRHVGRGSGVAAKGREGRGRDCGGAMALCWDGKQMVPSHEAHDPNPAESGQRSYDAGARDGARQHEGHPYYDACDWPAGRRCLQKGRKRSSLARLGAWRCAFFPRGRGEKYLSGRPCVARLAPPPIYQLPPCASGGPPSNHLGKLTVCHAINMASLAIIRIAQPRDPWVRAASSHARLSAPILDKADYAPVRSYTGTTPCARVLEGKIM